jgi:hypothetical protein
MSNIQSTIHRIDYEMYFVLELESSNAFCTSKCYILIAILFNQLNKLKLKSLVLRRKNGIKESHYLKSYRDLQKFHAKNYVDTHVQ